MCVCLPVMVLWAFRLGGECLHYFLKILHYYLFRYASSPFFVFFLDSNYRNLRPFDVFCNSSMFCAAYFFPTFSAILIFPQPLEKSSGLSQGTFSACLPGIVPVSFFLCLTTVSLHLCSMDHRTSVPSWVDEGFWFMEGIGVAVAVLFRQ